MTHLKVKRYEIKWSNKATRRLFIKKFTNGFARIIYCAGNVSVTLLFVPQIRICCTINISRSCSNSGLGGRIFLFKFPYHDKWRWPRILHASSTGSARCSESDWNGRTIFKMMYNGYSYCREVYHTLGKWNASNRPKVQADSVQYSYSKKVLELDTVDG